MTEHQDKPPREEREEEPAIVKTLRAHTKAAPPVDFGAALSPLQIAQLVSWLDRRPAEPAQVDPRPACISCGRRWVPREGEDATVSPCPGCAEPARAEETKAAEVSEPVPFTPIARAEATRLATLYAPDGERRHQIFMALSGAYEDGRRAQQPDSRSRLAGAEHAFKDLADAYGILEKEREELRAQRDLFRTELDAARAQRDDAEQSERAANHTLGIVTEERDEARTELAKANERIAGYQRDLDTTKRSWNETRATLRNAELRLEACDEWYEKEKRRRAEVEEENARLAKELEAERERAGRARLHDAGEVLQRAFIDTMAYTATPIEQAALQRLHREVFYTIARLSVQPPTDSAAKGDRLAEMAAQAGPLPTTLLAGSPSSPPTAEESERDIAIMALIDVIERPHPGRAGEFLDALERMFRLG